MTALLSSPGMIVAFAIVLLLNVASLLALGVVLQLYRRQSGKYRALCAQLGNATAWGRPGAVLLPIYVVTTVIVASLSLYLFIWQPHIL